MAKHKYALMVALGLQQQGWTYRTGEKHVILYPRDKTKDPIVMAKTPGGGRGINNLRSAIKRAGGDVTLLNLAY